jgi:ParB-like chromosome segregation protein Spo0J
MSASDALQPQQFVHHTDLAKMYSGDYDVPMHKVLPEIESDPDVDERVRYIGSGSSRAHIDRLASSIKQHGMKEPIVVRGGNVITDGHHRALAAMKLKMEQVPVRHVR